MCNKLLGRVIVEVYGLFIVTYGCDFQNLCTWKIKIHYTMRQAHEQGWQIYVE
jgi:hypothetical protein